MPQQKQQRTVATEEFEGFRDGARWINKPPTAEEFADWFEKNVPLDDGIKADKYVSGCVLIPAAEKYKVVAGLDADGSAVIADRERMTYIPYPKVEARINYFWDLMGLRKHEWRGFIDPVPVDPDVEGDRVLSRLNRSLPDGFFTYAVPVGDGFTFYIAASMIAAIYPADVKFEWEDVTLRDGRQVRRRVYDKPPIRAMRGTKQVPLTQTRTWSSGSRTWADDNAIMKAETGATGRALGMLGMLAVPGSGVATAEDMFETLSATPGEAQPAPQEAQPQLPGARQGRAQAAPEADVRTGAEKATDDHAELVTKAKGDLTQMKEDFPERYEEFVAWAQGRQPPIRDIGSLELGALRGTVKKIEGLLEAGREAQRARGESDGQATLDVSQPEEAPAEEAEKPAEEKGAEDGQSG